MRLLALGLFASIVLAVPAEAQAQQEADEAYWYVSQYKIPWAKVDSLITLEKKYSPRVSESVTPEQTGILDRKMLIHDTGTEYNVMIMTKYASWSAIREEGVNVMERAFPEEAERQAVQEAYGYIFEDTTHRDAIYREADEIEN